ncbi:cholinesterase 2-like [Macrosteles quadrilineatus]|uniref:cholinesterase 2-like n=1 Tax=Macrosteles quadrilineatus TaxID=74068 RepID=UPI0023E14E94|nr:cholinesterase 2-like [Macrosteles quadrilineatus]
MLLTSFVSVSIVLIVSVSGENITVSTSKGGVVGLRVSLNPATGVSYDAFLGVPYGKVHSRFQPPSARDAWNEPLLAQKDGPMCPQLDVEFNEDCLYLNVFTPVNASQTSVARPVMVYIHGGGFSFGSSSSLQYGPDFLIPQEVILVTANYRLGAAGFLTLGTPDAPGNLGLYDTMLALKWVQQEIRMFGGDPTLVTLFGHSAGSVLVMSHYISPVSTGLFKQAISQSGSLLVNLLPSKEAVRRAKLLSDAVGCDSSLNSTLLLSCLQRVDIKKIVAEQNVALPIEYIAKGATLRFTPVIDSFATNSFFPDSLDNLMKGAINRSKPLITGFAAADGIVKFQDTEQVWKLSEANLAAFIRKNNLGSLSSNLISLMTEQIRTKYFPVSPGQNKIIDLVNLYTDALFAYPTIVTTRAFANFTYGYMYDFLGAWNPMPDYFSQFKVTGVFHGAELTYLFYSANSSQDLGKCLTNLPAIAMRNSLVSMWTHFAKHGSPNASLSWHTLATGNYLLIGEQLSLLNSSAVEEQHYQFWADLVTQNNSGNVLGNLVMVLAVSIILYF